MRSLRLHFQEEAAQKEERTGDQPQAIADDSDFENVSKINAQWNARIAEEREVRLAKESEERHEKIYQEVEEKKMTEAEIREKLNETIRNEMVNYHRSMIYSLNNLINF